MLQNKYIIFFYKKFYASPFLLHNANISTCSKISYKKYDLFILQHFKNVYYFCYILYACLTTFIFATFYARD